MRLLQMHSWVQSQTEDKIRLGKKERAKRWKWADSDETNTRLCICVIGMQVRYIINKLSSELKAQSFDTTKVRRAFFSKKNLASPNNKKSIKYSEKRPAVVKWSTCVFAWKDFIWEEGRKWSLTSIFYWSILYTRDRYFGVHCGSIPYSEGKLDS